MVAAFWSEVAKYGKVTRVEEPVITLSEKERGLLAEHGVFIGQNPKLPLVKDFIYRSDLLFKTKPFAPTDKNMIVIFAESLNARMLESYNPERKGLTPNIARFAEDAMQVENYLNHAFPTIIGLRGQLCSIFPSMNNGVWNKGRSKFKTAKNKCMPRILDKNGFDTLYFGYSHPNETFFDAQMREFGFKQTYFYDELLAKFHPDRPRPGRGHYGNSDQQMFESLIGFLEKRASQKRFFLAMSTIETHPGMDVLEPEKLKDRFDSPVLRLIHNFDEQFGKFWSYFKKSKYSDNTIIVLTADHAHVPNMDYIKVAGDDYGRDRYFDPVTLIIHDPTRETPKKFSTQGSSIDFAPTMLQLLDVPNEKNHFLGLSLFSDRIKAKGALGIINKSRFLVNRGPGETKQPVFQIKSLSLESCASLKSPSIWPICALYRGIRFTQALSEKDQLYTEE